MISEKKVKQKTCKICKEKFSQRTTTQVVCSLPCAVLLAENTRAKSIKVSQNTQKRELKAMKEAIKTLTDHKNETQVVFNKWVRLRDGNKCITCGTENPNIQYAAGHYRTVKAASQHRYNPDNVHTQCNYACNSVRSGNISAYRPALIDKIGLERVLKLENDNSEHRYTIEELKQIKAEYTKKIRELKNLS